MVHADPLEEQEASFYFFHQKIVISSLHLQTTNYSTIPNNTRKFSYFLPPFQFAYLLDGKVGRCHILFLLDQS